MKITAYPVVSGTNMGSVISKVNEMLASGWQPLGGLTVAGMQTRDVSGELHDTILSEFYQVIVKYENNSVTPAAETTPAA